MCNPSVKAIIHYVPPASRKWCKSRLITPYASYQHGKLWVFKETPKSQACSSLSSSSRLSFFDLHKYCLNIPKEPVKSGRVLAERALEFSYTTFTMSPQNIHKFLKPSAEYIYNGGEEDEVDLLDEVLVIGIDFGTTYVPSRPLGARKMLAEEGLSAVELVGQYLHNLWEHILDTITRARGNEFVDTLKFHVVITPPAIWKGYARQGMKEAAQMAGILANRSAGQTTLSFAPEPEAAALSTISEPGLPIKTKEFYIVCDCGGGTVVSFDLLAQFTDTKSSTGFDELRDSRHQTRLYA